MEVRLGQWQQGNGLGHGWVAALEDGRQESKCLSLQDTRETAAQTLAHTAALHKRDQKDTDERLLLPAQPPPAASGWFTSGYDNGNASPANSCHQLKTSAQQLLAIHEENGDAWFE